MKRAIVDIDNTIWDFHAPLHKRLHELYEFPYIEHKEWNWYRDYGITDKQFYKAVDDVHSAQILHYPFDGAYDLFRTLDKAGYEVVVASHRRSQTAHKLAWWMSKFSLQPYSMLYVGPEKRQFFRTHDLLIDDAPHTIKHGSFIRMNVLYLAWPWNEGLPGERFGALTDIVEYIGNGHG